MDDTLFDFPCVASAENAAKFFEATESAHNKLCESINPVSMFDFFETGFSLPAKDNRFSRFNLRFSPWVRVLCQWFENPAVDWIYLIQGSQTCKTTFLQGALLYVSKNVSGSCPAFWAMSTEEEAKHFIDERLKPFLDDSASETAAKWKQRAFRFGNSLVKIGYAGNKTSLKSHPARFVFGDECAAWRVPPRYLRKRTRTFSGQRKGIFATTPPDSAEHASWGEAIAGDFYQWWVRCPECGHLQGLFFKNLNFSAAKSGGAWDYDKIKKIIYYQCQHCPAQWREKQKVAIINTGEPVCVDHKTYERLDDTGLVTKTLHVSALYSVFSSWADLAIDFLDAKRAGIEGFRIFVTDELAEVLESVGKETPIGNLRKLCDISRSKGDVGNYDLYTAGVDLQETGALYCTVTGWKSGQAPSCHVIQYFCVSWKDSVGAPDWSVFLEEIAPYQSKLAGCALDASNGKDYQHVCDFVNYYGAPFIALKEFPTQAIKTKWANVEIDPVTHQRYTFGQKLLEVNSHLIKNDISSAFERGAANVGSWSLPGDTSDVYLLHLTNEVQSEEIRRGIKTIVWKPKYQHAPQHYFSSLVYSVAVAEDYRVELQRKDKQNVVKKVNKKKENYLGDFDPRSYDFSRF